MKRNVKYNQTLFEPIDNFELGESIEEKMRKVTTTGEPIENVAPLIYTERKDGVLAETNIRTDRFEVAQQAMDAVSRSYAAKRESKIEQPTQPTEPTETKK